MCIMVSCLTTAAQPKIIPEELCKRFGDTKTQLATNLFQALNVYNTFILIRKSSAKTRFDHTSTRSFNSFIKPMERGAQPRLEATLLSRSGILSQH